ncbi:MULTISPECIES: hypothetical protein [Aliivibrio]|uniref:Phosphorelay protein LuxU n=1 Tax=Aliivibrio finisterrensis TaxID=511998 RepID=A0A4Q5KXY3_9GAMM|nr:MULTISPECIES: hypothetical protein [Aliivibrio]MDD9177263.1 hypothetical protein [Aliivibrio sp. A6]RYU54751.1 hypothetical protein ERW57_00440 [Aliivibrio finisterrensis]RYU56425.1 hypothetical protein ERW56_00120 [Aliivibrio finisterrensis]RYU61546.1 hypothetical protein ERW50_00120 [Aliivibrio finisterrensis]RYU66865.1 hypothetical protein ERW53_01730 [Aliivibrio finisterrensis]
MISCHINEKAFYSTTGVEFRSLLGIKFCSIAIRNLESIKEEIGEVIEHSPLIHKLKGIASSCGFIEAECLCKKLEGYGDIIKPNILIKTLDELIVLMLMALKSNIEVI